mmetsp:Transcript_12484/g.24882  ORF Transcript_12484/g.24882 Transcript_12484/m.24882 type:complete len:240 (-) Transcript_12484:808-1527(-)
MISPVISSHAPARGAFILFEGVDRCGKTTQCSLLLSHLLGLSIAASLFRFPDRTTAIGSTINSYLTQSSDLDDRAIHLLFSANRWERSGHIVETLSSGSNIVCDRYAYSGVSFSAAKEIPGLDVPWCKNCDRGLPAPDVVIFLDLNPEEAEKRGGYGGERYEKRDMQMKVRKVFDKLRIEDNDRVPWHVVEASGSVEEVQERIRLIVTKTIEQVALGQTLKKLWDNGDYDLKKHEDESK